MMLHESLFLVSDTAHSPLLSSLPPSPLSATLVLCCARSVGVVIFITIIVTMHPNMRAAFGSPQIAIIGSMCVGQSVGNSLITGWRSLVGITYTIVTSLITFQIFGRTRIACALMLLTVPGFVSYTMGRKSPAGTRRLFLVRYRVSPH